MTRPRSTAKTPQAPALEPWQQELLEQTGRLIIAGRLVTAPTRRSLAEPATAEPAEETAPKERGE